MSKINTAENLVAGIKDGATIAISGNGGGFWKLGIRVTLRLYIH